MIWQFWFTVNFIGFLRYLRLRQHIGYYKIGTVLFLICSSTSFVIAREVTNVEEFSRLSISDGHFVDVVSHAHFSPLGFNYCRVGAVSAEGGKIEHVELMPGFYESSFVEAMLLDAQRSGFNTVRVFQSYSVGSSGIITSSDATQLNPRYIDNVVDFLIRARKHNLYVIITSDWSPSSSWLAAKALPTESRSHLFKKPVAPHSRNNLHFCLTLTRIRANLISEMIKSIRKIDPALLNVVLAWELENESAFFMDSWPFNETSTNFVWAGETYNLKSDFRKQDLMDAVSLEWTNLCADAIHASDPHSLVSNSVFTFDAVRRAPPGEGFVSCSNDPRVPFRPVVQAASHVDYFDIHLYASRRRGRTLDGNFEADLRSAEWSRLKSAMTLAGKPLIAGEIGIDEICEEANINLFCKILKRHMQLIKNVGIQGVLYWSYGSIDSKMHDIYPPLRFYPALKKTLCRSPSI